MPRRRRTGQPWRSWLSLLLVAGLAVGCASRRDLADLAATDVSDLTPYGQELFGQYRRLAESEAFQEDWRDAANFIETARQVAEAGDVAPLSVVRDLTPGQLDMLETAGLRLQLASVRGGRVFAPELTARAQARLDCWAEQLEEGHQPRNIEDCRVQFERALAEVLAALEGDVIALLAESDGSVGSLSVDAPLGETVLDGDAAAILINSESGDVRAATLDAETLDTLFSDAIDAEPPPPVTVVLYFESGGVRLTAESEAAVDDILATAEGFPFPRFAVVGHTDTVGPAASNAALAIRRARAVGEILVRRGLDRDSIEVRSFGEADLLVETPDDTDEPLNRRVAVTIR